MSAGRPTCRNYGPHRVEIAATSHGARVDRRALDSGCAPGVAHLPDVGRRPVEAPLGRQAQTEPEARPGPARSGTGARTGPARPRRGPGAQREWAAWRIRAARPAARVRLRGAPRSE